MQGSVPPPCDCQASAPNRRHQSTKIVIQKHYIELTTLGRGFWEFASVANLHYHGKLFPIVGTAVGVDKNVQDGINGRFTSMVIYNEAGNAKLELREENEHRETSACFPLAELGHTVTVVPSAFHQLPGQSLIGFAFSRAPACRNGIYEWSNGLCETALNWSLSSPHFVFGLSLP